MAFEALFKGYPYDGIKSRETFVHRPEFKIDEESGRVVLTHIPDEYPNMKTVGIDDKRLLDFLFHRCFDFQQALRIAETQIADIYVQKEYPFIPEDFGFEKLPIIVSGATTYVKDRTLITRIVDSVGNASWAIQLNGDLIRAEVKIPNMLVAHALFTALGVITDEEKTDVYEGPGMTKEEMEAENSNS